MADKIANFEDYVNKDGKRPEAPKNEVQATEAPKSIFLSLLCECK